MSIDTEIICCYLTVDVVVIVVLVILCVMNRKVVRLMTILLCHMICMISLKYLMFARQWVLQTTVHYILSRSAVSSTEDFCKEYDKAKRRVKVKPGFEDEWSRQSDALHHEFVNLFPT